MSGSRSCSGRLFHKLGSAAAKQRLLKPLCAWLGTHVRESAERREHTNTLSNRWSEVTFVGQVGQCSSYNGGSTSPAWTSRLNITRWQIGSQWSCRRTCVVCWELPKTYIETSSGVPDWLQTAHMLLRISRAPRRCRSQIDYRWTHASVCWWLRPSCISWVAVVAVVDSTRHDRLLQNVLTCTAYYQQRRQYSSQYRWPWHEMTILDFKQHLGHLLRRSQPH